MRLFMEHKSDVLPVVERGRIIGQIDRLAIMEALSEIRPEGYALSIQNAETTEQLLRRLDNDNLPGLATINRNFEFNALWGRAEILQAQGKIPQVKIWQPAASPSTAETTENKTADTQVKANVATVPVAERSAPIRIVRETPPPTQASSEGEIPTERADTAGGNAAARVSPRGVAENLHREIERGRLAINTLAALDIPLLACDGVGNEIFHNRAFADIKIRDAINLKSDELVKRAKDAIAESALKGDLDIERPVKIRQAPRGFDILCKAIRDYDNPASRAVGYIFWLVTADSRRFAEPWQAHTSFVPTPGGAGESFAGKTLPDILAAEEARAMAWAMQEAGGNQSDAALLLGIPRQTFNYRYRRLMRAQNRRNPAKTETGKA